MVADWIVRSRVEIGGSRSRSPKKSDAENARFPIHPAKSSTESFVSADPEVRWVVSKTPPNVQLHGEANSAAAKRIWTRGAGRLQARTVKDLPQGRIHQQVGDSFLGHSRPQSGRACRLLGDWLSRRPRRWLTKAPNEELDSAGALNVGREAGSDRFLGRHIVRIGQKPRANSRRRAALAQGHRTVTLAAVQTGFE